MNAVDTYTLLSEDLQKSLSALLGVNTIEEIQARRKISGYRYEPEKHTLEYWIALGKYSVSMDLSYLAFVVNGHEQILPTEIYSKADIEKYVDGFLQNKDKVIKAFNEIIGHPNRLFIGYSEPITMEKFLEKVVTDIHSESKSLHSCHQKLLSLN